MEESTLGFGEKQSRGTVSKIRQQALYETPTVSREYSFVPGLATRRSAKSFWKIRTATEKVRLQKLKHNRG